MVDATASLGKYVAHSARVAETSEDSVLGRFGQYGTTGGFICKEIAKYLHVDEGFVTSPAHIVMTTGCQEAMLVTLAALCDRAADVLLISDPTFVGIHGAARLLGIETRPVRMTDEGLDLRSLREAVAAVQAAGKCAKALYVIPDFDNPGGSAMPHARRLELLDLARKVNLVIVEDTAYSTFAYDRPRLLCLKALDRHRCVVHLGSFSKTIFPGLRLGYVATDVRVQSRSGSTHDLALQIEKAKSFTSVNTSSLSQATIAGILIRSGYSLRDRLEPMISRYRANRDAMLSALERAFPRLEGPAVRWNRPMGGFFVAASLPFVADAEAMQRSARDYGVIWIPLSLFALRGGHERSIRLAFSYSDPRTIEQGIQRLRAFVRDTSSRDRGRAAESAVQ